jgi:hypothetical protein
MHAVAKLSEIAHAGFYVVVLKEVLRSQAHQVGPVQIESVLEEAGL